MSRRSAREVERRRAYNRSVHGGGEEEDLAKALAASKETKAQEDAEAARKFQEEEKVEGAAREQKGSRQEQEQIDFDHGMALSLESLDDNKSQQEEGKGDDDMDLVLRESLNNSIQEETLKLIDASALSDPDKELKKSQLAECMNKCLNASSDRAAPEGDAAGGCVIS